MPEMAGTTRSILAPGVTANTTVVIPAGHAIVNMYVRNNNANAVTGGIKVGTTSGATDVVVALAVAGSAFVVTVPVVKIFSASVDQTLFIQAVVSWNSANVDIVFPLERGITS